MDFLIYVPLLLFSLLLCLLLYLLFMPKTNHPRYPPGPRPLPLIGNIHNINGSLPHHAMRDLSRQYGPLMLLHLGPSPTIVVSSPNAAREIMKTHDVSFASRPISTTVGIFTRGGKGINFTSYGEHWRQMRKICVLELLSTRRVQSYRSIREEEVDNLVKYVNSCASQCQHVNLSKRLISTMNDITTRSIIGNKCKKQDMFLRELDATLKVVAGFDLTDLFPSSRLARLVSSGAKIAERSKQEIDRILDEVIVQHKEQMIATGESKEEDLLSVC
ncbi:cytochrome P450 family 71 polypeptide [Rhynchospora pubera]|uniref:Cytochrome P450 family 71 polypeptide n=1 Tax=Rhynchospora pubera TaxID=906938 RepID=A0AAV8DEV5_9POAL|nr:cytochrome P450 family 71 polypeptide [Rhynchospora pubera]